MPRNRKSKPKSSTPSSAADIPLSLPDFSLPSGPTLLQLADEKRGVRMMEVNGDEGKPRIYEIGEDELLHGRKEVEEEEEDIEVDPLATAILYTVSLCAVHTTLDVIVLTQYSQDLSAWSILSHLLRVAPALFLVLYLLHLPLAKAYPRVRQAFFLIASVTAGCWLMHAGNEYGYYAVMKRAPSLGTVWVWSVVEMELSLILVHLVGVGGYVWWNGYGNF